MVQAIDIDRPEREQTRTELTLGRIGQAWRFQPRGQAFTSALIDFLRSIRSPRTLRSYSFSILQLFEWFDAEQQRIPAPDQIRRADAIAYTKWLYTRDQRLIRERLEIDPSRKLDLQIFDYVSQNPGADYVQIYNRVATSMPIERFAYRLGCLVKRRTLTRTPTIEEYRRQLGGRVVTPPDDVFQYYVPKVQTPEGTDRASTIATRLSALSSFWNYLIKHSTENVPGREEPLLRYNIWEGPLKQAHAQAPSHRAATRAAKQTGFELFLQLLATTFYRSHGGPGPLSFAAAEAAFWNRPLPRGTSGREDTLKDLRDRALLLFMVQTGARSVEVHRLKRKDFNRPMVTLLGKRNKKRTVVVPPAALKAWDALQDKLMLLAEQYGKRDDDPTRGLRAKRLLERPDAPFIPAVSYWGSNAGHGDRMGLTREGIAMMLRRRAESAGITPGSADFARAHPHGLRGLFARVAIESGTPINRVQAIMGHASVATTGAYMEELRPEKLVAEAFEAPAVLPPSVERPRPVEKPRPPERRPVERPKPPKRPPPPERPERPERPKPPPKSPRIREEIMVERAPVEAPAALGVPAPAPAPPKPASPAEDLFVKEVVKRRKQPLVEQEIEAVLDCFERIEDESLRNLCVIYNIHWGEQGNRQKLVSTGGGRKTDRELAERQARQLLAEGKLVPNPMSLFPDEGADRAAQVYSGKQSGLNWWIGTNSKLDPAMPVMSPDQIYDVLEDLVELWRKWNEQSVTKAAALESWFYEAIQCSAQVQRVIDFRGGSWVAPSAPWKDSALRGTFREPEPRLTFREHLEARILEWFEERAGSYRTKPGTPEAWTKVEDSKVIGEEPPSWFLDRDPIETLPFDEQEELLDYLRAATGLSPKGNELRFAHEQTFIRSSRKQVAEFIQTVCAIEEQIEMMKEEDKEYRELMEAQLEVQVQQLRQDVATATGARLLDYDILAEIKKRRQERKALEKRVRREDFLLQQVQKVFGKEAAADPLVKLAAKCGKTPLAPFRDLFRVRGKTVEHTDEFKQQFALEYQTHSECVARRLARMLWEMSQGRMSGKQYVTKPELTNVLINSTVGSFKVPCSREQEEELMRLLGGRKPEQPTRMARSYYSLTTPPEEEEDEVRQIFEELQEEGSEAAAEVFRQEIFQPNARAALPTPLHFLGALVL